MKLDYYIFSSPGGREYNEDSADMRSSDSAAVFVLADGLGGHRYGDLASACAVDTILSYMEQYDNPTDTYATLYGALTAANDRIVALQREKAARMKSTAVILHMTADYAYWAHVGDSRLYHIYHNELRDITEDHSVAFKKYKAGEITREMIASDEDQSSLLRVLGTPGEVKPDMNYAPAEQGDAYMLCSDGVWEYLYDEEVLLDYHKASSAREWAQLMLLRVMERIPPDNDNLSMITVMT